MRDTISSGIGSLLSVMASHVRSSITFGADAPYLLSPRIHTRVRTDSGEDRFFHSRWPSDVLDSSRAILEPKVGTNRGQRLVSAGAGGWGLDLNRWPLGYRPVGNEVPLRTPQGPFLLTESRNSLYPYIRRFAPCSRRRHPRTRSRCRSASCASSPRPNTSTSP